MTTSFSLLWHFVRPSTPCFYSREAMEMATLRKSFQFRPGCLWILGNVHPQASIGVEQSKKQSHGSCKSVIKSHSMCCECDTYKKRETSQSSPVFLNRDKFNMCGLQFLEFPRQSTHYKIAKAEKFQPIGLDIPKDFPSKSQTDPILFRLYK